MPPLLVGVPAVPTNPPDEPALPCEPSLLQPESATTSAPPRRHINLSRVVVSEQLSTGAAVIG
jgi:hypothetical protein